MFQYDTCFGPVICVVKNVVGVFVVVISFKINMIIFTHWISILIVHQSTTICCRQERHLLWC